MTSSVGVVDSFPKWIFPVSNQWISVFNVGEFPSRVLWRIMSIKDSCELRVL